MADDACQSTDAMALMTLAIACYGAAIACYGATKKLERLP